MKEWNQKSKYHLTHSHSERPKQAWQFGNIFLIQAFFLQISEGKMLIRIQTTTLLQIFCEFLLYYQVIFKSMRVADDTFLRKSECKWVKESNKTIVWRNDNMQQYRWRVDDAGLSKCSSPGAQTTDPWALQFTDPCQSVVPSVANRWRHTVSYLRWSDTA